MQQRGNPAQPEFSSDGLLRQQEEGRVESRGLGQALKQECSASVQSAKRHRAVRQQQEKVCHLCQCIIEKVPNVAHGLLILEMFYLNTIEQLFLFNEQ